MRRRHDIWFDTLALAALAVLSFVGCVYAMWGTSSDRGCANAIRGVTIESRPSRYW
jgi:hypothetical protein